MNKNPIFLLITLIFTVIFLANCSKTVDARGYLPEPEQLAKIQAGKSTKEDVIQAFGSPSSQSAFGEETWYYIYAKTKNFAFLAPTLTDQQVVAVHFSSEGTVKTLEHYNLADAKKVQYAKDVTPTEGRDLNAMQQLLGNVGRFNPQGTGPRARTTSHGNPNSF